MFNQCGCPVERVNLYEPAKTVRFIRLKIDIAPVIVLAPRLPTPRHAVAAKTGDLWMGS
jgi:hypothetical protein